MKKGDCIFILVSVVMSLVLLGTLVWNVNFRTESALAQDQTTEMSGETIAAVEENTQGEESGSPELVEMEEESTESTEPESREQLAESEQNVPALVLEKQEMETIDPFPYYIKVNRASNCITIYTKDEMGEYTVPYKAMICSTGGATPHGQYGTKEKYEMKGLNGGVYGQYSTWIMGNILFHSVPCSRKAKDSLIARYYNQLGTRASAGCIRLTVADAKWIYDNCPIGTIVDLYDDAENPGPLGKPESIQVPLDTVWDPTDPDEENPWNDCAPSIEANEVLLYDGQEEFDIAAYVTAYDTCGNDITDKLVVTGNYNLKLPGEYEMKLEVTDLLGRTAEKTLLLDVR